MATQYVSSYFAQGEDGCEQLEQIDQIGAQEWLSIMSGAIDFTDGETNDAPPWGSGDSLVYAEPIDPDSTVAIHANYAMGYVSITLQIKES
jgi:hypothetical protein